MALPNVLQVACSSCKVASTCPANGSSPLVRGGKPVALCHLVGGYGRTPVDKAILSAESLARAAKDGECLTVAEVPRYDDASGRVYYETVKIFAPPVLHSRETTGASVDSIIPKSHK